MEWFQVVLKSAYPIRNQIQIYSNPNFYGTGETIASTNLPSGFVLELQKISIN